MSARAAPGLGSRGVSARRRSVLALALALALVVAPALASASWVVHHDREPDTSFDLDGHAFLVPDTDAAARPRVYFNVVTTANDHGMVSPNHQLVGSRLSTPTPAPIAFLGVWKDCNADGYVGMAEGVAREYRIELLSDPNICPVGSAHRIGGWVYEFLWIADIAHNQPSQASGLLRAPGTRIWGDVGAPGATFAPVCILTPMPRGTTGSTGGLVGYADCQNQRGLMRIVNALDDDGSKGLRFDDPEDPRSSDSLLNQPIPFHPYEAPQNPEGRRTGTLQEGSGDPAFTVWDCGAQPTSVRDPTAPDGGKGLLFGPHPPDAYPNFALSDEQGRVLTVAAPRVSTDVRPHGSYVDAANAAYDGVGAADKADETCAGRKPTGPGPSPRTPLGPPFESGTNSLDERPHRATDMYFRFNGGSGRVRVDPAGVLLPPEDWPTDAGLGMPTTLTHMGTTGRYGSNGPRYVEADATRPEEIESPLLDRTTLTPRGPIYRTYYARLTPATLQVADVPGEFTYGAEWCPLAGTDIVRGFDCDATRWWNTEYGAPPEPKFKGIEPSYGAKPGWPYHVRDVDCQDQRLARDVRVQEEGCS